MKAVALTFVALLAAPALAHADPVPVDQAPAQIARFVPVARAAWPASPCASREQYATITQAQLNEYAHSDNPFLVPAAGSDASTCTVYFPPSELTEDAMTVCTDLAHEFGHLALGATYYAASNPKDPAHDPNPHSLMHYDGGDQPFAPCSAAVGTGELTQDAAWWLIDQNRVDPEHVDCRAGRAHGEAICWSYRQRFRVTATTQTWVVQRLRNAPKTTKARHRTKR